VYVKVERSPSLPPPRSEAGVIGWLRTNLFSSWPNTLLTLAGLALIAYSLPPFLSWAVFNANWGGEGREACLPPFGNPDGACWVFIKARLGLLMYGFYPEAERWRIDLAAILLAASGGQLVAASLLRAPSGRARRLTLLFPLAGAILSFALFGALPGLTAVIFLAAPDILARIRPGRLLLGLAHRPQLQLGLRLGLCLAAGAILGLGLGAAGEGLAAALSLLMASFLFITLGAAGRSAGGVRFALLIGVYPVLAYILLLGGGMSLPLVETDNWGGLFLTLAIAGVGIATSLPVGILLALGRRSRMPVIKALSVSFIEFIRGVPLISVLFMASVMLPLTLPAGMHVNKLLRALVGVSLFYAAYMAEVVRGGLQAIPRGQYEAAEALGLRYWRVMRLVILPQALRLVIPGITNTFLGLLKDTTLVAVINLMDILGILKSALADTRWLGFTKEAYVFAALVFWVICFGLSRYSMLLEKRLKPGRN
jgi:general L-amino acid transport system permease protein